MREDDVTTTDLPADHYDAVTSLSVLHHLDLATVLPRLAASLRPGGVLVAVALPRTDLPRDLPIEVVSVVGTRVLGAAFRFEQRATGRRRFAHEASVLDMPMQDPGQLSGRVADASVGQDSTRLPGGASREAVGSLTSGL